MFDAGRQPSTCNWQPGSWAWVLARHLSMNQKKRAILGFPPEYHLRIAISFGYPQDAEILDEAPKKGGRKALSEIIHWQTW